MMALTSKQRKFLRARAHSLYPVAFLGQKGVTPEFMAEVDRGLTYHELIKVKIACDDQTEMQELTEEILGQVKAERVQAIGHILVLYRKGKEPKYKLPH